MLYCQLPLLVSIFVNAIPSTAPTSTSVKLEPSIVETNVPALFVSSSLIELNVGAPLLSNTGASFIAVETTLLVFVLVVKLKLLMVKVAAPELLSVVSI